MTHPPPGKYVSIAANQRVKREDEKAASPDPLPSDEAVDAAWVDAHEASRDVISQPTIRAALTAAYAIDLPRREAENQRLRELYENAVGNRERFGWTIDHLLECEEALRVAQENAAEVRAATLREVEALREALRFYSDGFAYLTPEGWRRIWRDGGQVAREALAHFNPEAEPKRPRNHAPWCCVEHEGPCDFNQETE